MNAPTRPSCPTGPSLVRGGHHLSMAGAAVRFPRRVRRSVWRHLHAALHPLRHARRRRAPGRRARGLHRRSRRPRRRPGQRAARADPRPPFAAARRRRAAPAQRAAAPAGLPRRPDRRAMRASSPRPRGDGRRRGTAAAPSASSAPRWRSRRRSSCASCSASTRPSCDRFSRLIDDAHGWWSAPTRRSTSAAGRRRASWQRFRAARGALDAALQEHIDGAAAIRRPATTCSRAARRAHASPGGAVRRGDPRPADHHAARRARDHRQLDHLGAGLPAATCRSAARGSTRELDAADADRRRAARPGCRICRRSVSRPCACGR